MSDHGVKVAQRTLAFWVMKICATTLGETAGDLLSMTLGLGYGWSTALLLGVFVATLAAQVRAPMFRPALYWSVILTTSTAGTTLSDLLDRTVGLGYATGAAILASLLLLILVAWRAVVGTIAVHDVRERKVEAFYWAAILVSNTLGTALGDYLADDSGLGFLGGALLLGVAIGLMAVLSATTRLSRVGLFWTAFVLTRPFGATFGDLLTKPVADGGSGLGTPAASGILLGLLLVAMAGTYVVAPRLRTVPAT